jgi:hypothetical protein
LLGKGRQRREKFVKEEKEVRVRGRKRCVREREVEGLRGMVCERRIRFTREGKNCEERGRVVREGKTCKGRGSFTREGKSCEERGRVVRVGKTCEGR